ncbi:MAG: YfhO family protein, partial [Bryobacteraceae bacterium]|nr:YfhO family protein [Bryobacteraceae bacterium]
IIAVALADIGNGTSYSFVSTEEKDRTIYLKKIAQSADVAGFLQKQPRPLRVEVADADIPYNFGDWYGIEQSGGYLASITTNLVAHEFYFARFRDLLSVNYSVVNDPPRPGALREGAVEVYYSPASKLKVYFNPSAYPLVRSVHNIVTADDKAITDLVRQDGLDLRTTAILREPPPEIAWCDAGEDRFRITRRVPGSVDITADMKCAGLLVLADTYFPGWKAWVDEKPAHIYDAYGAIRAVAVPEGTHTVTFRYRPASVFVGAAMSASGLLAAMLLTLVRKPVRHIDAKPTVQSY